MTARSKTRFVTATPRRSRTMVGSPHWGGGDTKAGGGGKYCPTNVKMRPMHSSGGHVEKAMRPPGLRTRSISRVAISGRGANMWANWLSTTSKAPSANGRLSASPSFHSTSASATAAFSRARLSNSGVRSSPVTFAPRRCAVIATTPVPQPTSRTRWPARIPANATSRGAAAHVVSSNGMKLAHACRWAALNCASASMCLLPRARVVRRRRAGPPLWFAVFSHALSGGGLCPPSLLLFGRRRDCPSKHLAAHGREERTAGINEKRFYHLPLGKVRRHEQPGSRTGDHATHKQKQEHKASCRHGQSVGVRDIGFENPPGDDHEERTRSQHRSKECDR